jgi:hypothetical protein
MNHDDFATEPVLGLPERPPEGEEILWQGRPSVWALTRSALALWWVMGYFAFLAAWRFVAAVDIMPMGQAIGITIPFFGLAAIVAILFLLVGFVQARTTVYTVTNRRVAMRIGAALTMTLNLPYTQIESADLNLRKDGTGTIALSLMGETRFSYVMCWPHIRPWKFPTQPALRCVPDAERVAGLIADAAQARLSVTKTERRDTIAALPAE